MSDFFPVTGSTTSSTPSTEITEIPEALPDFSFCFLAYHQVDTSV